MTNNLIRSISLNPMVFWADLGLRALDMTLSSSHSYRDGVDRLTRAAASNRAVIDGTAWSVVSPSPPVGENSSVKHSSPGLVMQGWLQWLSTLGTVASLGAGRGLGTIVTRQADPPEAAASSLPIANDNTVHSKSHSRKYGGKKPAKPLSLKAPG